jgi:very-short-patch-repair endonuclease
MTYEEVVAEIRAGNSLKNVCESHSLNYYHLYGKIRKDFPGLMSRKKSALVRERCKKAQEIPLDIGEVIRLYTVEKLSAREIAEKMGVVQNVILKRLREHGIPKNHQGDYWTDERREHQAKLCHDGVIGVHNPANKYRFTGIEQQFVSWLEGRNIEYERQKQLKKGRHRYDFHILGTKLLVEIDGVYWHDTASQREKDKRFIDEAAELDYNVVRFSDIEIRDTKQRCFERILEWI